MGFWNRIRCCCCRPTVEGSNHGGEHNNEEHDPNSYSMPEYSNRTDSDATMINEKGQSVSFTEEDAIPTQKKTSVGKAITDAGKVGGTPAAASILSSSTAPRKRFGGNPFKSKKDQHPEQPDSSVDARSKIIETVPFGPKRRTLSAQGNAGAGSSTSMAGPSEVQEQNRQGTGAGATVSVGGWTPINLTARLPVIQVSPASESDSTRPNTAIAGPSGQRPEQNEDGARASTSTSVRTSTEPFPLYIDYTSAGPSATMAGPSRQEADVERALERNWHGSVGASTGTAAEFLAATEHIENSDIGNTPSSDNQEST